MGKIYDKITDKQREWINHQKVYFVSTAPLAADGLVNVSPKGLDSFRILDDLTVAYLDLVGSGIETIANIQENQRITIMFTAFDGPPKILRLYGNGEAHKVGSASYDQLKGHFSEHIGARSIIVIKLTRIQDSCGWSIPLYEYKGDRDVYDKYCEDKGREGMIADIKKQNDSSLNQLPGF